MCRGRSDLFYNPELSTTGYKEHMLAAGMVFLEEAACAVVHGAEPLSNAECNIDVIRLGERRGERVDFVLGLVRY